MTDKPTCSLCGSAHWFLEACAGPSNGVEKRDTLASTATPDEIEKALAHYRAHKAAERDRYRRRKAEGTTSGMPEA